MAMFSKINCIIFLVLLFPLQLCSGGNEFRILSRLPAELTDLIRQYCSGSIFFVCSTVNKEFNLYIKKNVEFYPKKYIPLMRLLNWELRRTDQEILIRIVRNKTFYYSKYKFVLFEDDNCVDSPFHQGFFQKNNSGLVQVPFFIFKQCKNDNKEKFLSVLKNFQERERWFGRIVYLGKLDQFSSHELLTLHDLYPCTLIEDKVGNTILHALVKDYFRTFRSEEKEEKGNSIKSLCKHSRFLINRKNKQGNTPLHLAAALGLEELYELFENYGANSLALNKSGFVASYLKH